MLEFERKAMLKQLAGQYLLPFEQQNGQFAQIALSARKLAQGID
jgi:hypothetical protein